MGIVFDIATSAEFWRRFYPLNRSPATAAPVIPGQSTYLENDALSFVPSWMAHDLLDELDGVLHLLAFDASQRRRSEKRIIHVCTDSLPEGSFYRLSDDIAVMSPACMFLSAATVLRLPKLIAFGYELCGYYSFDARQKRGFRKRTVPLVTIRQLGDYLEKANQCQGRVQATTALQYVVEHSASPMETFDAMAMCLPYRLGGYGLRKFEMNHSIPLTCRAARIAKRQTCYADMCYPAINLDVEHHGKYDHCSPEEMAADRARVNALKEMGYEVVELTAEQVEDLFAFEYIIQRIARLDGKRISKKKLGALPQRITLRKELFGWNRSQGRLRMR